VRDDPEREDAEYARISLDKRGAAEGVETQQAENADAADELGLAIARSYVDNDLSAFSGAASATLHAAAAATGSRY
jgi:site-specific DNA recombinase